MLKSLNTDALKIVANLYDSKSSFREGLDRLLHDEIRNAVDLSNRLNKFIADSSDANEAKPAKPAKSSKGNTSGKRGRPPGSKNKPKLETPANSTENEEVKADASQADGSLDTKVTHGHAIIEVLKAASDGLTASEILDGLSKSSIEGYSAPSKGTLQTTLVVLRDKKVIKTKGKRPNTKYFAK